MAAEDDGASGYVDEGVGGQSAGEQDTAAADNMTTVGDLLIKEAGTFGRRQWKTRFVELSREALYIWASEADYESRKEPMRAFSLDGALILLLDSDKYPFYMELQLADQQIVPLRTETADDLEVWLDLFGRATGQNPGTPEATDEAAALARGDTNEVAVDDDGDSDDAGSVGSTRDGLDSALRDSDDAAGRTSDGAGLSSLESAGVASPSQSVGASPSAVEMGARVSDDERPRVPEGTTAAGGSGDDAAASAEDDMPDKRRPSIHMRGPLSVKQMSGAFGHPWKEHTVAIVGSQLFIFKSPSDATPKEAWSLIGARAAAYEHKSKAYTFAVETPKGQLQFMAADMQGRDAWIDAINGVAYAFRARATSLASRRSGSGGSASKMKSGGAGSRRGSHASSRGDKLASAASVTSEGGGAQEATAPGSEVQVTAPGSAPEAASGGATVRSSAAEAVPLADASGDDKIAGERQLSRPDSDSHPTTDEGEGKTVGQSTQDRSEVEPSSAATGGDQRSHEHVAAHSQPPLGASAVDEVSGQGDGPQVDLRPGGSVDGEHGDDAGEGTAGATDVKESGTVDDEVARAAPDVTAAPAAVRVDSEQGSGRAGEGAASRKPVAARCVLRGDGAKHARIGEPSVIVLLAMDGRGRPVGSGGARVTAKFGRCMVEDVEDVGDGTYNITYRATPEAQPTPTGLVAPDPKLSPWIEVFLDGGAVGGSPVVPRVLPPRDTEPAKESATKQSTSKTSDTTSAAKTAGNSKGTTEPSAGGAGDGGTSARAPRAEAEPDAATAGGGSNGVGAPGAGDRSADPVPPAAHSDEDKSKTGRSAGSAEVAVSPAKADADSGLSGRASTNVPKAIESGGRASNGMGTEQSAMLRSASEAVMAVEHALDALHLGGDGTTPIRPTSSPITASPKRVRADDISRVASLPLAPPPWASRVEIQRFLDTERAEVDALLQPILQRVVEADESVEAAPWHGTLALWSVKAGEEELTMISEALNDDGPEEAGIIQLRIGRVIDALAKLRTAIDFEGTDHDTRRLSVTLSPSAAARIAAHDKEIADDISLSTDDEGSDSSGTVVISSSDSEHGDVRAPAAKRREAPASRSRVSRNAKHPDAAHTEVTVPHTARRSVVAIQSYYRGRLVRKEYHGRKRRRRPQRDQGVRRHATVKEAVADLASTTDSDVEELSTDDEGLPPPGQPAKASEPKPRSPAQRRDTRTAGNGPVRAPGRSQAAPTAPKPTPEASEQEDRAGADAAAARSPFKSPPSAARSPAAAAAPATGTDEGAGTGAADGDGRLSSGGGARGPWRSPQDARAAMMSRLAGGHGRSAHSVAMSLPRTPSMRNAVASPGARTPRHSKLDAVTARLAMLKAMRTGASSSPQSAGTSPFKSSPFRSPATTADEDASAQQVSPAQRSGTTAEAKKSSTAEAAVPDRVDQGADGSSEAKEDVGADEATHDDIPEDSVAAAKAALSPWPARPESETRGDDSGGSKADEAPPTSAWPARAGARTAAEGRPRSARVAATDPRQRQRGLTHMRERRQARGEPAPMTPAQKRASMGQITPEEASKVWNAVMGGESPRNEVARADAASSPDGEEPPPSEPPAQHAAGAGDEHPPGDSSSSGDESEEDAEVVQDDDVGPPSAAAGRIPSTGRAPVAVLDADALLAELEAVPPADEVPSAVDAPAAAVTAAPTHERSIADILAKKPPSPPPQDGRHAPDGESSSPPEGPRPPPGPPPPEEPVVAGSSPPPMPWPRRAPPPTPTEDPALIHAAAAAFDDEDEGGDDDDLAAAGAASSSTKSESSKAAVAGDVHEESASLNGVDVGTERDRSGSFAASSAASVEATTDAVVGSGNAASATAGGTGYGARHARALQRGAAGSTDGSPYKPSKLRGQRAERAEGYAARMARKGRKQKPRPIVTTAPQPVSEVGWDSSPPGKKRSPRSVSPHVAAEQGHGTGGGAEEYFAETLATSQRDQRPPQRSPSPTRRSRHKARLPREARSRAAKAQESPDSKLPTGRFLLNKRVTLVDGRRGVTRYIGLTQFASGEWIGVELDEPEGKNDGCVGGVRYFTCSKNEGIGDLTLPYGLFVRRNRIKKAHKLVDGQAAMRSPSRKSPSRKSPKRSPTTRTVALDPSASVSPSRRRGAGRHLSTASLRRSSGGEAAASWQLFQQAMGTPPASPSVDAHGARASAEGALHAAPQIAPWAGGPPPAPSHPADDAVSLEHILAEVTQLETQLAGAATSGEAIDTAAVIARLQRLQAMATGLPAPEPPQPPPAAAPQASTQAPPAVPPVADLSGSPRAAPEGRMGGNGAGAGNAVPPHAQAAPSAQGDRGAGAGAGVAAGAQPAAAQPHSPRAVPEGGDPRVIAWLHALRLAEYVPAFRHLSLEAVQELTRDDIAALDGIEPRHLALLVAAVQALRQAAASGVGGTPARTRSPPASSGVARGGLEPPPPASSGRPVGSPLQLDESGEVELSAAKHRNGGRGEAARLRAEASVADGGASPTPAQSRSRGGAPVRERLQAAKGKAAAGSSPAKSARVDPDMVLQLLGPPPPPIELPQFSDDSDDAAETPRRPMRRATSSAASIRGLASAGSAGSAGSARKLRRRQSSAVASPLGVAPPPTWAAAHKTGAMTPDGRFVGAGAGGDASASREGGGRQRTSPRSGSSLRKGSRARLYGPAEAVTAPTGVPSPPGTPHIDEPVHAFSERDLTPEAPARELARRPASAHTPDRPPPPRPGSFSFDARTGALQAGAKP